MEVSNYDIHEYDSRVVAREAAGTVYEGDREGVTAHLNSKEYLAVQEDLRQ